MPTSRCNCTTLRRLQVAQYRGCYHHSISESGGQRSHHPVIQWGWHESDGVHNDICNRTYRLEHAESDVIEFMWSNLLRRQVASPANQQSLVLLAHDAPGDIDGLIKMGFDPFESSMKYLGTADTFLWSKQHEFIPGAHWSIADHYKLATIWTSKPYRIPKSKKCFIGHHVPGNDMMLWWALWGPYASFSVRRSICARLTSDTMPTLTR